MTTTAPATANRRRPCCTTAGTPTSPHWSSSPRPTRGSSRSSTTRSAPASSAPFEKQFGDRLVNVGIAEQDMVGVAAGLANGGKIPFVSAAALLPHRPRDGADQGRRRVLPAPHGLCGQSPGMAYGELGPTHHSIEDLGWLRTIPGLTVLVPSDPTETAQAIRWAAAHDGPVFVRVSPHGCAGRQPRGLRVRPGQGGHPARRRRRHPHRHRHRRAGRWTPPTCSLSAGISARVLSMPSIKPLDEQAVLAAASETRGHRHGRGGPDHRAGRRGGRGRRPARAGAGCASSGVPGHLRAHRTGRVAPRPLRHQRDGHRGRRLRAGGWIDRLVPVRQEYKSALSAPAPEQGPARRRRRFSALALMAPVHLRSLVDDKVRASPL